jgi:hypothetical protein
VYAEEWAVKLQEELDEPNKYEDICLVEYTNSKVVHNPYGTDPTVSTGERGTPYTFNAIVETDQSVTINTYKELNEFIDRADLAQSTLATQMTRASRQGVLLRESIESGVYSVHGSMTQFDDADMTGGSGSITVATTNVATILRKLTRAIREAGGQSLYERNGGFVVWRPAEFEILEAYMQANGFTLSDYYLKNGTKQGAYYGGFNHYTSNLLDGGHCIGGVKKAIYLGILTATFGQVVVDDKNPTARSGVSISSRVDFKPFIWQKMASVVFDIRCA